jgi:hypothetical protein
VPQKIDQRIGNLGLTDDEDHEMVEFMPTLKGISAVWGLRLERMEDA